jgi:hypothetical protein
LSNIVASLAQAVVAPGSDHVGRTIGKIDFLRRYGVIVLSLWPKEGWLDQELARTNPFSLWPRWLSIHRLYSSRRAADTAHRGGGGDGPDNLKTVQIKVL